MIFPRAPRAIRRIVATLAVLLPASVLAAPPDEPRVEIAVKGLVHPWGMAFLPDGRALITERQGRLRIANLRTGTLSGPVSGLPPVLARGQGGLLGIALHPQFAGNREVFLCFSEARESGNGTSVFRARFNEDGTRLTDGRVIFRQMPAVDSTLHFGCRLVFDRAGNLFVTLGDRYSRRTDAQNLTSHLGKIVRIRPDGSIPSDNPFLKTPDALPEIWSYGHRNVQGATLHPGTGRLYTAEHGARGGDEINAPEAGRNYGWPVITYGIDYSGAKIGIGTRKDGMEQPLFYWDPSIAPSGATFYTGDKFPAWRGSLLVGGLAGSLLARLELKGDVITGETRYLEAFGKRIRDVVEGPDGYVYLLSDETDGALLRLVPGR
ncbi:MAG: glucose sorbosone [Beijerinckiaceae bacterium]|nr:MAG: glucose sorbosone [Beijerinckiaceae bacterium]